MVSQRNSGRLSANGTHAKKRHARDARGTLWDMSFQPPPGLKAELDKPLLSRHKGYFIQVENKDKKEKKLEYLVGSATTMLTNRRMTLTDLIAHGPATHGRHGVCSYWESCSYREVQRHLS